MGRIWFDTEFIEDGKTIDLLSIGMVRDDGATLYLENIEADLTRASDWVKQNVFPHLAMANENRVHQFGRTKKQIADEVLQFAGPSPEFWAYFADYDWVALCQLYGTMMGIPDGWPKFCLDLQQVAHDLGSPSLQRPEGGDHHALGDALWVRDTWHLLQSMKEVK